MIDREHGLSIVRQADALSLSRSSVYYTAQPPDDETLSLMRLIDRLHLEYPFAGSRMLRDLLRLRGITVGRRRVRTLMRRMGIEALYRKPNTSKAGKGHRIYPYLRIRCINGRFPRRAVRIMIPGRSLRRHSGPAATLRSPRPRSPAAAR